jgi:uncharacterized protein YecT (DUF1311 family)
LRHFAIAVAIILLVGTPARAQPRKDIDCKSQNLNMLDIAWCGRLEFEAADAALNTLYREMIVKYDASNQALLKTAQESWMAFRDAECTYETSGYDGDYGALVYHQCRTAKTKERITVLNRQLHCQDGAYQGETCNRPKGAPD